MMYKYIIGDVFMRRGVKQGYKQTKDHIDARFANRIPYNKGKAAHNRYTTQSFIGAVLDKWPDIPYRLDKLHYITNNVKVVLVCPIHGDFEKWPSDVLNRSGCAKCKGQGFSKEEYLSELADRFPEYDFSDSIYINATTDMNIRCTKHGLFRSTRNKLLNSNVRCPKCSAIRVLQERVATGKAKDPELISDFEKYKKAVWKETNRSYKLYKEQLGERSRTRHLDHIYSILHGFRDGILPVILGNIVNLRIIDARENQSKNVSSHCTKEELIMLYEERNK